MISKQLTEPRTQDGCDIKVKQSYFPQILALSETHGREDKPWPVPKIDGFKEAIRSERKGSDKGGGGLCLYVKENIDAHPWKPSIPDSVAHVSKERQWLLMDNRAQRLAFLHCYIACQTSRNNDYIEQNEHLLGSVHLQLKLNALVLVLLINRKYMYQSVQFSLF